MFEFMTVRELYEIVFSGSHVELDSIEYVQLQGWIRTNRCSGVYDRQRAERDRQVRLYAGWPSAF